MTIWHSGKCPPPPPPPPPSPDERIGMLLYKVHYMKYTICRLALGGKAFRSATFRKKPEPKCTSLRMLYDSGISGVGCSKLLRSNLSDSWRKAMITNKNNWQNAHKTFVQAKSFEIFRWRWRKSGSESEPFEVDFPQSRLGPRLGTVRGGTADSPGRPRPEQNGRHIPR